LLHPGAGRCSVSPEMESSSLSSIPVAGKVLRMTTAAEHGLEVQAWWGKEPYDPRRVGGDGWPKDARHKPDGRFFTSSWEGHTSAWIEYQASTARAAEARSVQLFLPDPEAVLYVIDSPDDYDDLVQVYPHYQARPEPCPDWRLFFETEGPDAVHVTAAGVAQGNPWFASAWTVESTAWLRPRLTLLETP